MVASMVKDGVPRLMIQDDMQQMLDVKEQSKIILDVFQKVSHHSNLSVIFIAQDLTQKGTNLPRIKGQCSDVIIMGTGTYANKNLRDFGGQVGMNGRYLRECLSKLKARDISYPYLCVSPNARMFTVRYGITPHHPQQIFFVEKGTVTTPKYIKSKRHAEEGEKRQAEEARRQAGPTSEGFRREERMAHDGEGEEV
jgi:hypothetical protein